MIFLEQQQEAVLSDRGVEDQERFVSSVSRGVRAMPAWEGTVKPEEIEAIWAYIGSVNGWK